MGYTISIGNAVFESDKDEAWLRVTAESAIHDDAPVFPNDTMTGNGNSRSPSYTGWSDFCRHTGLYGMFYGKDGRRNPYMEADPDCHREVPILADHPGFQPINEADAVAVENALRLHIAKYGELTPGFRGWREREEDAPEDAYACAHRARLMWLAFWVRWAVDNCDRPIIANS